MNHNGIFSLSFPEAKTIIVSGDIHGDFNQLVFKLCIQYQLTDSLLIVAGDCGFGLEQKEYYEQMVRRTPKLRTKTQNMITASILRSRFIRPVSAAVFLKKSGENIVHRSFSMKLCSANERSAAICYPFLGDN